MEERTEVEKSGRKGDRRSRREAQRTPLTPVMPVCTHVCTCRAREVREAPQCGSWFPGGVVLPLSCPGCCGLTLQTEGSPASRQASGSLLSPRCSRATGFLLPSFINLSLGSGSCDNSLEALLGLRSSWIRVLALPHPTCTPCSSSVVFHSAQAVLSNMPARPMLRSSVMSSQHATIPVGGYREDVLCRRGPSWLATTSS